MASGEMSPEEFIRFSDSWLAPMVDMLADGAILHVCIDWRMLHELITATRSVGLSLINLCVWNKPNGGMGSLYRSKHELVLVLKKDAHHISTKSSLAGTVGIGRTSGKAIQRQQLRGEPHGRPRRSSDRQADRARQ